MAPLVVAGAAVVLTVVLLVLVVVLLRDGGEGTTGDVAAEDPSASATGSPTASSSPSSDLGTTQPPPTETLVPVAEDVASLPAGMFCRDLIAQGYSYTASVDYWYLQGQPDQMDADRNGIPCETVYPAADVTAFWSP